MTIKARLFDQFRKPHGALGMLAGRVMSKRSSNQQRSAWTVGLLDVQPADRVLEIGFGPGLGIAAVLDRVRTGQVVGIDHSATMQAMASKRATRVTRGNESAQPDLRVGDVETIAADFGIFDKIFSCNVWLFWKDPVAVFERLRSHLAPGGTIAVTHLPRHGGATREASLAAGGAIAQQLARAGYSDVRQEILELEPIPAVCVLALSDAVTTLRR